jgi:acyl-CoA hydrolase
VREAVAAGRADYTPISMSDIEIFLESGELPLDVALIQTSLPDAHGFLSLGVGVDCTLTACRMAKRIIVEMNHSMPRSMGDTFLHISKVAAMVETSRPLYELKPDLSTPIQERVAANVATLIPDGATLQMGIGGIPNAVWSALRDHRDLGIHSEMCSDGVIPLIEAGVVNGSRKSLHRGKVVAGFVLGSQELFDFIHENPAFDFHPTRYVNDPCVIGQNDNMIAVNSALQVDLTGQVCADSMGTRPYSGFGGQLDFMRGAGRSKGGKPIIALPSTAKHGTVSRIVPVLESGAGVVTTRSDVHYVVTEHGIAYLRGKTIRQRAEALIAIADPKFRDGLQDFAERTWHLESRRELVA